MEFLKKPFWRIKTDQVYFSDEESKRLNKNAYFETYLMDYLKIWKENSPLIYSTPLNTYNELSWNNSQKYKFKLTLGLWEVGIPLV